MGWTTEKNGKDGWHGIPVMSWNRWDVGGGLRETDNEEETNISGAPAEKVGMPRVQS